MENITNEDIKKLNLKRESIQLKKQEKRGDRSEFKKNKLYFFVWISIILILCSLTYLVDFGEVNSSWYYALILIPVLILYLIAAALSIVIHYVTFIISTLTCLYVLIKKKSRLLASISVLFYGLWLVIIIIAQVNSADIQNDIMNYLKSTYGREFVVQKPPLKISAKKIKTNIHLKDIPEVNFEITWDKRKNSIKESFLRELWKYQAKKQVEKILADTYGHEVVLAKFDCCFSR